MSKWYRVTFEGYLEGEYENEDDAKQALIDYIEECKVDQYGRSWHDLIDVEDPEE